VTCSRSKQADWMFCIGLAGLQVNSHLAAHQDQVGAMVHRRLLRNPLSLSLISLSFSLLLLVQPMPS
jgi:hypothetical protein